MTVKLKLPIGIDNFEKIRRNGFYYVDKTKLIEQLLERWGEVNLFTRPRRFGKTLNMSMLRSFFEIGTDKSLFDGLYICHNKEFCEQYMGKFPVIFISLKGVEGLTFESAKSRLTKLIGREAERFYKNFAAGDCLAVENYLTKLIRNSISTFDTKSRKGEKENSYHMILTALLAANANWFVKSNVEAGDGFADIVVETEDPDVGIIVELKHSANYPGMEKACENAIEQIKSRRYDEYLKKDDRHDTIFYGMAFCKKKCKVIAEKTF